MRVLLIDDDEIILEFLRLCLESQFDDAEVEEYQSLARGRPDASFNWSAFDLLLLDYNLGDGETGVDWLKAFGDRPGFPKTIMITAVEDPYIVASAIRSGAEAYLSKSDLTPDRLTAVVRDVLGSRPPPDQVAPAPLPSATEARVLADQFEREVASEGQTSGASYRFGRVIGRGAMSTVYLAERVDDGQTVVLKIMSRELQRDAVALRRFVREGELVATLDSPFVVKIFEQGFTNSYAYIAMEFFGRGDLKQLIEQGVSADDALLYLYNIARGLDVIHGVGIVHRDLKPANIMIRTDGSMALADFGISKRLDFDPDLTAVGSIVGTPHYLSPEQAQGSPASPSSDLYGAGVVFYEMLTGERPYRGDTVSAVLFQHLHAPVPTLPEELARLQPILARLLAKAPEARYRSASELARALSEQLAGC